MTLDSFLYKHNILLEQEELELCQRGIGLMQQSIDQCHTEEHIHALFEGLDSFLEQSYDLKDKVRYNVMLLAICWHDVWKANRNLSNNFLMMLYENTYDGFKSARIYKKVSKEYK